MNHHVIPSTLASLDLSLCSGPPPLLPTAAGIISQPATPNQVEPERPILPAENHPPVVAVTLECAGYQHGGIND